MVRTKHQESPLRVTRCPSLERARSASRSFLLALGAITLVAGLSGCSGDDSATLGSAATATPSAEQEAPAEEPTVSTVRIARVDGKLDPSRRAILETRVGGAVDAWIDGAYEGTYPRDDFAEAFTSFTRGAARRAKQDADLLSNAGVGLKVDDVRVVRRRLNLDVLGVAGRAVAVTARVDLVFELIGDITRRDTISGRLFMTFEKSSSGAGPAGWRVFGYALNRKEV